MRFARMVRRRFDLWASGVPRQWTSVQPKDISPQVLSDLMDRSTNEKIGANGRPTWLAENISRTDRVVLFPQNLESEKAVRCNAAVFGPGGSEWIFSVDVLVADYDRLPDISRRRGAYLLNDLLFRLPVLPLDEDQAAAWRELRVGGLATGGVAESKEPDAGNGAS